MIALGEDMIDIMKEEIDILPSEPEEAQPQPEESQPKPEETPTKPEERRSRLGEMRPKSEEKDSTAELKKIKEENELLRIQLLSRGREIEELRRELDDIYSSISYRVGKWIAETKVGRALKSFLWKYFLNKKKPVE